MVDKIKVTVLPDGSLRMETDKVSMANHGNAEMLFRELAKGMGGNVTKVSKGHNHHGHSHEHGQEHNH